MLVSRYAFILPLLLILAWSDAACGQLEFESAPINYSEATPHDAISELQSQLNSGSCQLEYLPKGGYLASVLENLKIPQSSQMLVFSKTSLQLRRISPQRPRAIYFNDESYVGWVQGGDVIEISTVDPQLGAVFYTLSTNEVAKPAFLRDQGQCMTCHASSRTEGVPGHVMRSVFADRTGQPHYGSGTYSTNQASPFEKRWGGWYVSGMHGEMRHMGNVISAKSVRLDDLDRETGANVTDLSEFVSTKPYLQDTSDIVALMVLGHQLEMHNLITRGNFEARSALHYDGVMNKALEREVDFISDSTQRRVASVGEKILRCLFFADEEPLTSPIKGTSTYHQDFQKLNRKESNGRSLRDFDLQTRLFKYPCSYLIYSEAYSRLPKILNEYLSTRIIEILKDNPAHDEFTNLSLEDRKNIHEILLATKPELFQVKSTSK